MAQRSQLVWESHGTADQTQPLDPTHDCTGSSSCALLMHITYSTRHTQVQTHVRDLDKERKKKFLIAFSKFPRNTELDDPASIKRLVQVYRILNGLFWQKVSRKNTCCFSHTHLGTKDCNPATGRTHPRKTAEVCPQWECCRNTWRQGYRGYLRIAPSWKRSHIGQKYGVTKILNTSHIVKMWGLTM